MGSFIRNLLIIVAFGFLFASVSLAQSAQDLHDAMKKNYFRLKNIDPKVTDLPAWEQVIADYKNFIQSGVALNDKVFFEYGSLLQEFAVNSHKSRSLEDASQIYDELIKRYPTSSLADDAMLKQTEILSLQGGSSEAIKESYTEIVEKFPKSDSAEIARARLTHVSGFSSADPDSSESFKSSTQNSETAGLPVVVIDPGHGGEDFGAENDLGLFEKDVVLSIGLEAERLINQRRIAKVLLTRRSDVFIPLPDRIALANKNNATLFLSLHNNASPKHNQFGVTTYVLDDSSDDASKLLAERENKSAGGNGESSDLDLIMSDLVQSSKHPKSLLLADAVNKSIMASVRNNWSSAKSLGIKKGPFYVLVGARMPCALVELFFLDHEVDGEKLADPDMRKSIAAGVARGIEVFLNGSRG